MRNKFLFTVLFSLIALSVHAADPRRDRDGNWWRGIGIEEKTSYTTGFFDGIQLGHKFSYWAFSNDDKKGECLSDVTKSFVSFSEKYLQNVTNGQLVDGLDAFYSDYRNRSISIDDAVWLVANSIAGTPQDKLDKMIENFRRNVNPPMQH
jgi:hypothetical protein